MAGTWESWLFGGEILLSTIIPILLVWSPGTRGSPVALGVAAFSASVGLALNRMDVGIFGYFRDAGVVYFPSLAEWAVSLGVVAAAALVFLYFAENMGVFADSRGGHGEGRPFGASFDSLSRVWHVRPPERHGAGHRHRGVRDPLGVGSDVPSLPPGRCTLGDPGSRDWMWPGRVSASTETRRGFSPPSHTRSTRNGLGVSPPARLATISPYPATRRPPAPGAIPIWWSRPRSSITSATRPGSRGRRAGWLSSREPKLRPMPYGRGGEDGG